MSNLLVQEKRNIVWILKFIEIGFIENSWEKRIKDIMLIAARSFWRCSANAVVFYISLRSAIFVQIVVHIPALMFFLLYCLRRTNKKIWTTTFRKKKKKPDWSFTWQEHFCKNVAFENVIETQTGSVKKNVFVSDWLKKTECCRDPDVYLLQVPRT